MQLEVKKHLEDMRRAIELLPKFTVARRIVDFRNILIHAYDVVDEQVVWDIVERKLPVLGREVESLLAEQ